MKNTDFDFKFDFSSLTFEKEREAQEVTPRLNTEPVMFENALDMLDNIDISKDYFCFVSGSFIFGDFLEALLYHKKLAPSVMYITTLGMSAENIDSIYNLTHYLRCKQLNLLVSNYFAAVERHKLVPYLQEQWAGEPINVAVLASHCKCALIRSDKGDLFISGSANLSSSNNVEQFVILHNADVMDFVQDRLDKIFDKFTLYKGKDRAAFNSSGNRQNTIKQAWEVLTNG